MFHQDQRRIATREPNASGGPDPLAAHTVGKRAKANLPGDSNGTDRTESPCRLKRTEADFGKVFRLMHLHRIPSEQRAKVGGHDPPKSPCAHSPCKGPLNGPTATGNHCPEGWTFYKYPGPGFDGFPDTSAEASYYTWVDQHNTLGLGANVPISTANLNDGFVALKDGTMVMLRIPYPMGFYAKGLDGRIDDPNTGWKGRGLWSTSGDRTPWLMEGGKGSRPRAVHIQMRPDPLAN